MMELRKTRFWLIRDVYKYSEPGRLHVRFEQPEEEEGGEILDLTLEED